MDRCHRCHVTRRNHYTLIKTQEQPNEYDRVEEELVVGIFHHPDLHGPSGRWIYDDIQFCIWEMYVFTDVQPTMTMILFVAFFIATS